MCPAAATAASRTSGTSQRARGTASLCNEPGDACKLRASPPLRSLSESGEELYRFKRLLNLQFTNVVLIRLFK